MTCERREATGYCDHYQCPFKDETEHGYQCVDVVEGIFLFLDEKNKGICECGDGCLEKCKYSFDPEVQVEVTKIFSEMY